MFDKGRKVLWNTDIEMYLRHVAQVISEVPNISVIIAGDFNSKFAASYAKQTDDRGMAVEDFIITNELFVLNNQDQYQIGELTST